MSTEHLLFLSPALFYALASLGFAALLARGDETLGRRAKLALGLGFAAQILLLVYRAFVSHFDSLGGIHQTLSIASLLLVLAFLSASARYPLSALGAFVAPLAFFFALGAGLTPEGTTLSPRMRSLLLPVHIGLNLLGVVAFALAFALSLAYVLQERQLRRKQLGGIFKRLPPLDVLDSLGLRLVAAGFPLLTLGIVTGTIFALRIDPQGLSPGQGFAILAWVVFAGVLLLRFAAGWRGRRAAIGTILGFLCALVVLLGYVLRAGGGG